MSEEIRTAHEDFQAKVAALNTAQAEYEAVLTPYLEKKAALVAAIDAVDSSDNALEELTKNYEPPTHPGTK